MAYRRALVSKPDKAPTHEPVGSHVSLWGHVDDGESPMHCNTIEVKIGELQYQFMNQFKNIMTKIGATNFVIFGGAVLHLINPDVWPIRDIDVRVPRGVFEGFYYASKIPLFKPDGFEILTVNKTVITIKISDWDFPIDIVREIDHRTISLDFKLNGQLLTWNPHGKYLPGWSLQTTPRGLYETYKGCISPLFLQSMVPSKFSTYANEEKEFLGKNMYRFTKMMKKMPEDFSFENLTMDPEHDCCICNTDYSRDIIMANIDKKFKYVRTVTSCNHYICIGCLRKQCLGADETRRHGRDGVVVSSHGNCPVCRTNLKYPIKKLFMVDLEDISQIDLHLFADPGNDYEDISKRISSMKKAFDDESDDEPLTKDEIAEGVHAHIERVAEMRAVATGWTRVPTRRRTTVRTVSQSALGAGRGTPTEADSETDSETDSEEDSSDRFLSSVHVDGDWASVR